MTHTEMWTKHDDLSTGDDRQRMTDRVLEKAQNDLEVARLRVRKARSDRRFARQAAARNNHCAF